MAKKKPTIKELQQQIDELNESLKRERADAANVRRRADDERMRLAATFKAMTVKELLPAIDNFERAMMQADDNDFAKGMSGIQKQFMQMIET